MTIMVSLEIDGSVRRKIRKLRAKDPQAMGRVQVILDKLNRQPIPAGAVRCRWSRLGDAFRLRQGDVRVLFIPGQHGEPTRVTEVGYRREAYREGSGGRN
ncbi:type II toxin-antitoxin system RelE/ParE family toxin [Kitasatospora sp. NPDC056076]|uniref:type II toxin-antitoxin system RelE family toxin n=1 Tax=Kitasatospora sp. NPDC056076 TaxID=3345703 RepID=UPI0035D9F041